MFLLLLIRFLTGCFGLDAEPEQKSPVNINDLAPEILLEIFYKLPIKQLHQIKIVCKLWSSLISNPSFLLQYKVQINSSPSPLTLYQKFGDIIEYSHIDEESMLRSNAKLLKYNKVLASCNKFLLCTKTYYHSAEPYHVYNLETKQWFPVSDWRYCTNEIALWGIVCYRKRSCWIRKSEKSLTQITHFKIVKIVRDSQNFHSNDLKMEIFDSTTNEWNRKIMKKVDRILMFSPGMANALEHRGILYWRSEIEEEEVLLAFDTNLDTCFVITLPGITGLRNAFGTSQNHLYYVTLDFKCTRTIVWRYDEFKGEKTWTVHYRFGLDWIDPHIYVDLLRENAWLLAVDPVDCKVLYVSALNQEHTIRRVYSLDLERKVVSEIYSSSRVHTNTKPICRVLPYM